MNLNIKRLIIQPNKIWKLKRLLNLFHYNNISKNRDYFCKHEPSRIRIETTNMCNLKCITCPLSWKSYTRKKETMSMPLFNKIIDEVKNFRPKPDIILYMGGEPLLNINIFECIKIVKDAGLFCIFNTNATLLTCEISKKIINSKLDMIEFSFDDILKKEYENMRINAIYEKTLSNIITFLKIKKRLKRKFPIVIVTGIKLKNNKLVNYCKRIEPSNDFIKLFKGYDVNFSVYYAHNWGKGENKKTNPCIFPNTDISILSNGLCVPCCYDLNGDYVLGDIKKNNIMEIWNNNKYKKFRKLMFSGDRQKINLCRGCPL